jgi:hypothetical protein
MIFMNAQSSTEQSSTSSETPETSLYLDLLKRCLVNSIYSYAETAPVKTSGILERLVERRLQRRGIFLRRHLSSDEVAQRDAAREIGKDWPPSPFAHAMTGMRRLENVQHCVESVINDRIPGDLIETGVWRGGASIMMRATLKAHKVKDRIVWAADSFEGLPKPDVEKYPADKGDIHHTFEELAVPLETVKRNFDRYGLLDSQVRFLKGWFSQTLAKAPIDQLAVIRLDGDMYESTMDALNALYSKLSVGGYVIVDDYGCVPGCAKAVDEFRSSHGIADEMWKIDWTGAFWRRSR